MATEDHITPHLRAAAPRMAAAFKQVHMTTAMDGNAKPPSKAGDTKSAEKSPKAADATRINSGNGRGGDHHHHPAAGVNNGQSPEEISFLEKRAREVYSKSMLAWVLAPLGYLFLPGELAEELGDEVLCVCVCVCVCLCLCLCVCM